jgi:hypothetical protein
MFSRSTPVGWWLQRGGGVWFLLHLWKLRNRVLLHHFVSELDLLIRATLLVSKNSNGTHAVLLLLLSSCRVSWRSLEPSHILPRKIHQTELGFCLLLLCLRHSLLHPERGRASSNEIVGHMNHSLLWSCIVDVELGFARVFITGRLPSKSAGAT